jgi:large subunit ribosomal protein L34e
MHFKREIPAQAKCGVCGGQLAGIPRLLPSEIRQLSHSKRSISRIYGGQVCPNCLKTALKFAARALNVPAEAGK